MTGADDERSGRGIVQLQSISSPDTGDMVNLHQPGSACIISMVLSSDDGMWKNLNCLDLHIMKLKFMYGLQIAIVQ